MSHRRIATVIAVVCAAAFTAVPAGASAGASAARHNAPHNGRYPNEPLAVGTGGAVASMDVGASRAGIDVLRRGGNAIDAAVATASALGVTVPFVAGPGGGGFMVIYNARTHTVTTIDGRETCPSACTTNLFIDPTTGKPMNYTAASDQPLSTGVPGNVATWATAVRKYGRLSLGADLQPAIGLAKSGFAVNFDFNQLEQSGLSTLQAYPASRSLLLTPSGDPLPIGTRLRDPDLAHTYEMIARRGPSALYDGPIGQAIVQADDHPVLTPGQTIVTNPGHHGHERSAVLPHQGPRADPGELPGTEHLRDGAALERRLDRGRDPQHPERLSPRFRASRRGPVPLPRGVPARLRRPQRVRRRPRLRQCAARRSARSEIRGDAPLPDRQHRGHLAGRGRLAVRAVPGLQRHRLRRLRPHRRRPRPITRTTSSPRTSGATSSRTRTPSTSSAAVARSCPATASCSTTS